jgi:iron-sulfur cluster repair protein YtfE (RIC family)
MEGTMSAHPARREAFDTVTAYLTWDHDELDLMLHDVVHIVDDQEWEQADDHMRELAARLTRHIQLEEAILFPLFEERVAMIGPTQVMRSEHREILAALDRMRGAIESRDPDGFSGSLRDLVTRLTPHNDKEENVLYPAIDRAVSQTERATLLDRVLGYRAAGETVGV